MKISNPIVKIVFALILACLAGYFAGPSNSILGVTFVQLFGLIGELFLSSLSLVVVPLVASSIILGAARMGADKSMGALGTKTFFYFFLNTTLAVLVGYFVITTFSPGLHESQTVVSAIHSNKAIETNIENIQELSQDGAFIQFKGLLLKILPSNILATAAEGQMIGMILFCLLFGFFSAKIESKASSIMLSFWEALFQIMMKMTQFFMQFLPIGVFGLVAKVVATSGLEAFQSVAWFFGVTLLGLGIHIGIVLPILLKFVARVSPLAHFKAMAPALLTAFSTSSSAASLPVVLDCLEKRANVSNRVCGFTVPLGTAVSLAGSAMYECLVVFFIAQAYGIEIPFTGHILIIAMAILTSFGLAGIPSACLIAIVVILQTLKLPVEGLGLILAVERILDMFRTATNVFGNTCCAVLVAKSVGETQVLVPQPISIEPTVAES